MKKSICKILLTYATLREIELGHDLCFYCLFFWFWSFLDIYCVCLFKALKSILLHLEVLSQRLCMRNRLVSKSLEDIKEEEYKRRRSYLLFNLLEKTLVYVLRILYMYHYSCYISWYKQNMRNLIQSSFIPFFTLIQQWWCQGNIWCECTS